MNGREFSFRLLAVTVAIAACVPAGMAFAQLECYQCHGSKNPADIRPVDSSYRNWSSGGFAGNHRAHLPGPLGSDGSGNCGKCHPGSKDYTSGHRDGKIKLSSNINASPLAAVYVNHTSTFRGWTSAFPQTSRPLPGTCWNVNCHFEKATPTWASPPLGSLDQCDTCHGAPPSDGSHRRKHDVYLGTGLDSCTRCHTDHRNDSRPFAHASSAGTRPLAIKFETDPNSGGSYGGPGNSAAYPDYLPSQNPKRDGTCTGLYCHSDGKGGNGNVALTWSDKRSSQCFSCHKGRSTRTGDPQPQTSDSTFANCTSTFGTWSSARGFCTPTLTMDSNAHHRLIGAQWVRKYPCYYCHNATTDLSGNVKDPAKHLNKTVDVQIAEQWEISNRPKPAYDRQTKVCNNVYCHSDGTRDPDQIRPAAWTDPRMECNSCHGHPRGACGTCHNGSKKFLLNNISTVLRVQNKWPDGQEWKASLPMFPNQGPGTGRANSHARHVETNFTCDKCHSNTVLNGTCTDCHTTGIPPGSMDEVAHINPYFHVNKDRNVDFRDGGHYDPIRKTCSGTTCHTGTGEVDPVWGGSVNSGVTCLSCHSTTAGDVDSFGFVIDGVQARINKTEWETYGHGRYSSAANTGSYPKSGNPAANFPGNPCWYCHDNNVLHNYSSNPFRLRMHNQYKQRFEKECVYCHMERTDAECMACHVGQPESLSPQATPGGISIKYKYQNLSTYFKYPGHGYLNNCTAGGCHDSDNGRFPNVTSAHKGHDSNAGVWTLEQKKDIENQYMYMGVCLQCHDDDTGNQCTSCHVPPPNNPNKYALGFNPGTGYIKPRKARASGGHFGYKHYRAFTKSGGWTKDANGKPMGTWKGGKFCWDCHDPHGDNNIYMIHNKVATTTDGKYGVPLTRATVSFTDNQSGTNYAKKTGTIDGICNVCHSADSKHFTSVAGDGHNITRRCTNCHEHRFADSHAAKQSCDTCHSNEKPIPKHTSFGLPRDCTKCHAGTIGKRMDVMGQMKANSHHVQGIEVTNRHCYACHWESTPIGLIDIQYHTGYNYLSYTSVKNDVVDLVVYGRGTRPAVYRNTSTAEGRATVTKFLATNMGTAEERNEVSKISNHCLSCHSDDNNDTVPFGDCKTPRQYAWDLQSVAARYSQKGTTTWGKYPSTPNAAQKNITKSFSAHGNGVANGGGWNATTGVDGAITDTRGGVNNRNVQCFDCHNSHGSKVVGVTSSYVTFNGTNNGGNLKETKKDMGGYSYDYKASANSTGVNPYGAGAGQCFDCHNTANAGEAVPTGRTPWGYSSTFGATAPIMGYRDTARFGQGTKAFISRYPFRDSKKTIVGGHLNASIPAGALPHLAKASGSVTGGSSTTMTDGSKSWTPDNKWVNLYIMMESGNNSGQLRKITASTASTLTFEPFNTAVTAGDTYSIVPYSNKVNGLCTPCHDPHGVSPALGSNQRYAVPLLKGTWMTSPYKDDNPQPDTRRGYYLTPVWKIDRNTFSTNINSNSRISENDSQFAGLCTNCHAKNNLVDGANRNTAVKTLDRIHESVKGWGTNNEHAFTCSKCHQPHVSGLPRLMQTNCLNYTHRGKVPSGGIADHSSRWGTGGSWYGFPRGGNSGLRCHNDDREDGRVLRWNHIPEWPANYKWNDVTQW